MQTGISTACLYPETVESSLETLVSLGFRTFEVFLNTCSEMTPDFLQRLKTISGGAGGSIRSVHPFTSAFEGFLLFSNYERRFLDGVRFYEEYFRAAQLLGASIVVLHGQKDYRNSSISEEEYIDRYAHLYSVAKGYGITLAQENVNRFRSEDPAFIRRMRRRLGEGCAFVLDIKQAVRAGQDPFEMCAAMGERLVHVHINDNTGGEDCLLPGQGTMDYARLTALLRSFRYQGDFIIEIYSRNFAKLEEFCAAKRFIDEFLQNF